MTHKHKEAFCIMTYRCDNCGRVEYVWNGRDGVTPFMISCRSCDGVMTHTEWERDRYAPEYNPGIGQRVFVTPTNDQIRNSKLDLLVKAKDSGIPDEAIQGMIEQLEQELKNGAPIIIEWTEKDFRNARLKQREARPKIIDMAHCGCKCGNKDCVRNSLHVKDVDLAVFADLKNTEYCPGHEVVEGVTKE